MKKDTSWGNVAGWYDEHLEAGDTYQERVILPNLLRLLGDIKGKKILDLACGQGFFSRAFAEAGAIVTGVDISEELVAKAKEKSPSIRYEVSPANDLKDIESGQMEEIVIVLALQNIENIQSVFEECHRVLAPKGKIHIVLNHPVLRTLKKSSWGFDDEKKIQYRRLDGYMSDFKTEVKMHPGLNEKTTVSFHRPLQSYFKALSKSKFSVTRLEEWISHKKSQPGPRSKAEDEARKEFPLFLFLEAVRQ